MPYIDAIRFVDDRALRSFEIDDVLYVLSNTKDQQRDTIMTMNYCLRNDIIYKGETLALHVINTFKSLFPNHFSNMNPETFNRFTQNNEKTRAHIGKFSEKYTDEEIQRDGLSYDIIKCYRYCMMNPMESWMFFAI
jgi:hypothetical protein